MRFVASLMPAKFSYYDRGVQLSKNRFHKIFCNNKITKFLPCASWLRSCQPSSPTMTGGVEMLHNRFCEILCENEITKFLPWASLPPKFSYYDRGLEFSQHKNNSAKIYAKTKSPNFCKNTKKRKISWLISYPWRFLCDSSGKKRSFTELFVHLIQKCYVFICSRIKLFLIFAKFAVFKKKFVTKNVTSSEL